MPVVKCLLIDVRVDGSLWAPRIFRPSAGELICISLADHLHICGTFFRPSCRRCANMALQLCDSRWQLFLFGIELCLNANDFQVLTPVGQLERFVLIGLWTTCWLVVCVVWSCPDWSSVRGSDVMTRSRKCRIANLPVAVREESVQMKKMAVWCKLRWKGQLQWDFEMLLLVNEGNGCGTGSVRKTWVKWYGPRLSFVAFCW